MAGLCWTLLLCIVASACASDEVRRVPGLAERLDVLRSIDVRSARTATGRVDHPAFVHYDDEGETEVSIAIVPNAVAVLGPADDARAAGGLLPGATAFADGAHVGFLRLRDEGVYVLGTELGRRSDVAAALAQRVGEGRVGVPALVPVTHAPPEEWPAVLLSPEIVVALRPGETPESLAAQLPADVEFVRAGRLNEQVVLVRSTSSDPQDWVAAARAIRRLPACDGLAQPNLVARHELRQDAGERQDRGEKTAPPALAPGDRQPSDPLLPLQWHLRNEGQAGGCPGADVGALDAWKHTRGEPSILVAIVDPTGVDLEHEDLAPNARTDLGWDYRENVQWTKPTDAHGTAAAGVAVARDGNGLGGAGIAPRCGLIAVRSGPTDVDKADAILQAAEDGAAVISASWGLERGVPVPQVLRDAIQFAAERGRPLPGATMDDEGDSAPRGCVVVFAMTNEWFDNFGGTNEPKDISAIEGVIAVGRATNKDRWGRSGYGDGMSLLAPSQSAHGTADLKCDIRSTTDGTLEITTTDLMGDAGYNAAGRAGGPCGCNMDAVEVDSPNYTSCFGGTSAAAPMVAGVAALVLSARRHLRSADVRTLLESTARLVDRGQANYDEHPETDRLYSVTHGYGRVDAWRAVSRALGIDPGPYEHPDCPSAQSEPPTPPAASDRPASPGRNEAITR